MYVYIRWELRCIYVAYMGVGMHPIATQTNGNLLTIDIKAAIRDEDPHYPRSA